MTSRRSLGTGPGLPVPSVSVPTRGGTAAERAAAAAAVAEDQEQQTGAAGSRRRPLGMGGRDVPPQQEEGC
jgi:hypothetical protein